MYEINEKTIRSIIRKNLLKEMISLNENTATPILTSNSELSFGKKIKDSGVDGYAIKVKDSNSIFFVPNSYYKDKKGDILFRVKKGEAFVEPNSDDLTIVQNFVTKDAEEGNEDTYDPSKNKISTQLSQIMKQSPLDIFKISLTNSFGKIIEDELKSTFGKVNADRERRGLSGDTGISIADVLSQTTRNSYGDIVKEILSAADDKFLASISKGVQAAATMFGDSKQTGEGLTGASFKKIIEKLVEGDEPFSYYHFHMLSKQFATERGETIDQLILRQDEDDILKAGNIFADYIGSNAMKGKIPLFYITSEKENTPVFTSGKNGYEQLRSDYLNHIKEMSNKKGSDKDKTPTPGKEKLGQTPKKGTTSTIIIGDRSLASKTKGASGGIRMSVSSDSDNSVKGFDDLGFKSGTDDYIRKELRRLVRSERKFRGTGVLNLEILFNKFGRVSKVKFRKGQGKLAARQVERLRSRIKEILGNAKYEDYRSRDAWYQDSGVKDRMDKRGKGGRNGSKVNMTVKMF